MNVVPAAVEAGSTITVQVVLQYPLAALGTLVVESQPLVLPTSTRLADVLRCPPASILPNTNEGSTTCTVDSQAAPGDYTVTATATSGGQSASNTSSLRVQQVRQALVMVGRLSLGLSHMCLVTQAWNQLTPFDARRGRKRASLTLAMHPAGSSLHDAQ